MNRAEESPTQCLPVPAERRSFIDSVVVLFLSSVAILANLQPSPFGGRLLLRATEQTHGLPLVYMERADVPPWAVMTTYHGPWPFLDATPAIVGFSWVAIVTDIVLGLVVVLLATRTISNWLQRRTRVLRGSLLLVMLVVVALWGAAAARALHSLNRPWGDEALDWPSALFLWFTPACLYLLAMFLAYTVSVRFLLRPARLTAVQSTRWMVALFGTIGFVDCVVREFVAMPWQLDFASISVAALVAVVVMRLLLLLVSRRGPWRHEYVVVEPTLLGIHLLAWCAAFIVAGTGVLFAFFDVTAYAYPEGGITHFYAYGWPWIHLLSAETEPELLGYRTSDGWTIGRLTLIPWTANILVLFAASIGTLWGVQAAMRIESFRPAFRLRHLLMLSVLLAVPLALSEPAGRRIMWTNWYVHGVLVAGLVGAGYLVTKTPQLLGVFRERIWSRQMK